MTSVGSENVELVGATTAPLPVAGAGARTTVRLDRVMRDKVRAGLAPAAGRPDRVFLNLENIRGAADGGLLQVYVGLPEGAKPSAHPELRAGSVGLFGVDATSHPDGGAQGMTAVLEITRIVEGLHLADALPENLAVTIVPLRPLPQNTDLSIGRVSVYRQGR